MPQSVARLQQAKSLKRGHLQGLGSCAMTTTAIDFVALSGLWSTLLPCFKAKSGA
jgi:hypothetical protein